MVVISFVHIVLFHLQEVKNEAVDLKILIDEVRELAREGYKEITLLGRECKFLW